MPTEPLRPQLLRTQVEKLHELLADGNWHSTKELIRRVGHRFAVPKFMLIRYGYMIEARRHPWKRWQYQYRLVKDEPRRLRRSNLK